MSGAEATDPSDESQRRRSIAFINWAHAIDHFVLLIFPTVVIGLEAYYGRSYGELIALSTAAFVAFGVFSLPAGWLADRWSRRNMMALFYAGCGLSLALAAMAPNLVMLGVALFLLGMFAAIYHPVGMPMLIDASNARGRTLAFNGVCGNVGAALAAAISAALATWLGWRFAFLVPAAACIVTAIVYIIMVPNDHHRIGKRQAVAEVVFSRNAAVAVFSIYIVISLCSGLVFNTISIALPKIVDERIDVPLVLVGGLATAVFLCGALAQLAMGRLVERIAPHILFAAVVVVQLLGLVWSTYASGPMLLVALAVAMAAVYAQVTVADVVIARYTADAWRGRMYAVKYFLTFISAGAAASVIGVMHSSGGFDLVLGATATVAALLVVSVLVFVAIVSSVESKLAAVQPAE
jgi:MFS family permease